MKHFTLTICAAALLFSSCNNDSEKTDAAKTDTTKTTEQPVAKETAPAAPAVPDSATMMKNWQAYMTPGDIHKMMASWDGTWASEMTMWEKPGAAPSKSTGVVVNKMVLGGRYQESIHKSTMMGMPFEGHSTLAYDNAKKVFESTWADNMGSGIMMMSGTWDTTTKSITFIGKGVNPSTFADQDYREIFRVVDENSQFMEMYGPGPDGKEMKLLEIKFTRKK